MGGLIDPDRFGLYVLLSGILCPFLNAGIRAVRKRPVTSGRAVMMVVLGVSLPSFIFMALSLDDPTLLSKISDKQVWLGMAGLIGLSISLFQIIDIDS